MTGLAASWWGSADPVPNAAGILVAWAALACIPVGLSWPVIRRMGFNANRYALVSLTAIALATTGEVVVLFGLRLNLGGFGSMAAFVLVWAIYLMMSSEMTAEQRQQLQAAAVAEDEAIAALSAMADAQWDELVVVQTYLNHADQIRFNQDVARLEAAGIAWWVRGAGITNLFVQPEDAERASEALEASDEP